MPVFKLGQNPYVFPAVEFAEPDGLLAIGGDLSVHRLITAYSLGIFPWYNPDDPPMWWCPNPRCVIYTHKVKVSKSMRQILKKKNFMVTVNQAFEKVIYACQKAKRNGQDCGTWITDEFIHSYSEMFNMGLAFSVEVWKDGKLCGGLYGVKLGTMFFGESMFSNLPNFSKIGFITFCKYLAHKGIEFIDCQIQNPHLESLGAEMIDGALFRAYLNQQVAIKSPDFFQDFDTFFQNIQY